MSMKKLMPQEIEVWYIIPALRRELTRIFLKDYKLSQKKTAEILGVSEAAVSQYLTSKRASEVKFSKVETDSIKKVARDVIKGKITLMAGLYDLCIFFRGSKTICSIHRIKDKSVDKKCRVCMNH